VSWFWEQLNKVKFTFLETSISVSWFQEQWNLVKLTFFETSI
jgi:hypothetical protein